MLCSLIQEQSTLNELTLIKIKKTFLLFFSVSSLSFATSVHVKNDSPFKLTAIIMSAGGKNLGTVITDPQTTVTWHDTDSSDSKFSKTPYTIIFRCPQGEDYGICTGLSPGGMATAQGSIGERTCHIPKKKDPSKK